MTLCECALHRESKLCVFYTSAHSRSVVEAVPDSELTSASIRAKRAKVSLKGSCFHTCSFYSSWSRQSSFACGECVMDVDATSRRRRLHDPGSPFTLRDRLHPTWSEVRRVATLRKWSVPAVVAGPRRVRALATSDSPDQRGTQSGHARELVEAALGQVGVDKLVNPVSRHNTYRDSKDPR